MTGLLILVGLILVILNVLSIKKQNKSFNGALGNAMGSIGEDDIRLGELRREFSESILELQSEIMDMKEIMEKNNSFNKDYDAEQQEKNYNFPKIKKIEPISLYSEDLKDKIDDVEVYAVDKNKITIGEPITRTSTINSNSEKVDKIKKLFSEGLSTGEISEILHLGKGEVLLIKDLYIK